MSIPRKLCVCLFPLLWKPALSSFLLISYFPCTICRILAATTLLRAGTCLPITRSSTAGPQFFVQAIPCLCTPLHTSDYTSILVARLPVPHIFVRFAELPTHTPDLQYCPPHFTQLESQIIGRWSSSSLFVPHASPC